MRVTDWIVRRWARYGHERLYAETPGGTALGYLDVKTGRYHSDDLSNLPLLEHAISEYVAAVPATSLGSAEPAEVPAEIPAAPAPIQPEWTDISGAAPGAAARERARAERAAQGTVVHLLARLVGARTNERAWRIGADGEQAVAAELAKLGPDWRILHAVRVGTKGSDIDHVVIGPGGVFTINAKHHPQANVWVGGDTVMINGTRVPYVRNSRHEADRASRLLSEHAGFPVHVYGLIAVMGANRGFTIKSQPSDGRIVVVKRRDVARYIQRFPVWLTPRHVETIYDVARRSSTWL
jgi:hypothetical protein